MSTSLKQNLLLYGFVAATLMAGGSSYALQQDVATQAPTMNRALEYYGFVTPAQKEALRFLMQQAEVSNTDALLDSNGKDLARTILDFVRQTQNKFTIRTGNQERWDVQTSEWMKDPVQQQKILKALTTLDMIDAVSPSFSKRDVVCILGASRNVMVSRFDYAGNLFAANELPSKWLVLLAGERYVTPDKNGVSIDGSESELDAIAAKLGKNITLLTETDLMISSYQESKLFNKLPTVIIDTPRRDLPRPTTETTVTEFCDWLKQHPNVQSITFVSNQPHVDYQKAIIAQVFEKQGVNIKYEVIGAEYNASVVNNNADKINYILQALGSRIWAETPKVLDELGLDMSDPQLRAEYLELYKKQPLIYNNLNTKFKSEVPLSNTNIGLKPTNSP